MVIHTKGSLIFNDVFDGLKNKFSSRYQVFITGKDKLREIVVKKSILIASFVMVKENERQIVISRKAPSILSAAFYYSGVILVFYSSLKKFETEIFGFLNQKYVR